MTVNRRWCGGRHEGKPAAPEPPPRDAVRGEGRPRTVPAPRAVLLAEMGESAAGNAAWRSGASPLTPAPDTLPVSWLESARTDSGDTHSGNTLSARKDSMEERPARGPAGTCKSCSPTAHPGGRRGADSRPAQRRGAVEPRPWYIGQDRLCSSLFLLFRLGPIENGIDNQPRLDDHGFMIDRALGSPLESLAGKFPVVTVAVDASSGSARSVP